MGNEFRLETGLYDGTKREEVIYFGRVSLLRDGRQAPKTCERDGLGPKFRWHRDGGQPRFRAHSDSRDQSTVSSREHRLVSWSEASNPDFAQQQCSVTDNEVIRTVAHERSASLSVSCAEVIIIGWKKQQHYDPL